MAHSPHEGQISQGFHCVRSNSETNTRSPPASQESTLNDSLSSQLSQVRPNAAGDVDLIRPHGAMTPSTSLSNKSSQEASDGPYLGERPISPLDQDEDMSGLITDDALDKPHTGVPKRMANGEVKPSKSSLPTSPVESSQYGHSRNSSRKSRGSQIGELSNQLRTRLSYAMVKVQNGWQSHNISELESMTSIQAPPGAAVSDAHWLYEGHVPIKYPADQSKVMPQYERTAAAPNHAYLSPGNGATTSGRMYENLRHGNFDPGSRPIKVGAAYESFWRDREASGTSRPTEAHIVGPSLAPPADIVARAPRRSDVTRKQPPPLLTNNLGTSSAPLTPPPRSQPKIRTPSQQAEVEKDAVESLLFMSSPGNSAYHPPGAFAQTALRNHYAHHTDLTDSPGLFKPDEACGQGKEPGPSHSQHLQRPARKRPLSDAEMDKMLDEMPDTSSSDDGEVQDQRPQQQILGT